MPSALIWRLTTSRQLDREMLGQQRAVVLGEVGHRGEVAHAPVIDPLPDLPHAHLRLPLRRAGRDQRVAQLVARQADDVQPARPRAACAGW